VTVPRGQLWDYPLFGLPYNGLATNEVLTLPGGGRLDYTFSGHQAVLVEGRNKGRQPPRTPAQQELERQHGYNFRSYALLTGTYREIGGVALGPQSWLYCDEDHAWIIRFDVEPIAGTNRLHCKLVLVNVFGLLEWDGTPPTMAEERVLAEAIFPLWYRYIEARVDDVQGCPLYPLMTHSRHGDTTTINLCTTCDFQMGYFGLQYEAGIGYQTHTVLTAAVTGKGSISAGMVGRGISGGITVLAQGGQLVEGPSSGGFETWSRYNHFAATMIDGAITWLTTYSEVRIGYQLQSTSFAGVEVRYESHDGTSGGTYAHMIAPNVWALQAASGGTVGRRVVVSADGRTLEGYFDTPGAATARLVAYNPGTGQYAVAPTSSDVVQWV
jgi:hypothetical protein